MPSNDNDKATVMTETGYCSNSNVNDSIHSKMNEKEEKVHSEDKTNVNGKTALANTIQTIQEESVDINDNMYKHKKFEDETFVKKLQNPDIKIPRDDGNTDPVIMPTWREYFGIK
jgi:hypothetical protein